MNFATLKSLTIPEGKAVKITQGSTVLWQAKPIEEPIVNLIDTVGVTANSRLSSSGAVKTNTGTFVTGSIGCTQGDVIRTVGAKFYGTGWDGVWCYRSDGSYWTNDYTTSANSTITSSAYNIIVDGSGNLEITVKLDNLSLRLCGSGDGSALVVTKNREIG